MADRAWAGPCLIDKPDLMSNMILRNSIIRILDTMPRPVGRSLRNMKHFVYYGRSDHADIFKSIYKRGFWFSQESVSGAGSEARNTICIRDALEKWLQAHNIRSIVDLPCGDFNWMKEVRFPESCRYVGIDIVDELVALNRQRFSGPNREFHIGDILSSPLPKADVLFCRDLFIHFPNAAIRSALARLPEFKCRYFMSSTSPDTAENIDIKFGQARPVNLEIEPFCLGSPVELLPDFDQFEHKYYIGVWRLEQDDDNTSN